jgi:RNA polymerase sigma-70 factor (ECF subfamily)
MATDRAPPVRSQASEAMGRYADGDASAFSELYDQLAPRLHAYLLRMLRSKAAADDALQQVFLQIHLNRGRFTPGARVEPWAYAIAHAAAVDLLRRERRRVADEFVDGEQAAEGSVEAVALAGELSEALRAELREISPKLREAFLLVRVEGLSHAEAAAVLGIEETATKVRTHRATLWLRERLARFVGEDRP